MKRVRKGLLRRKKILFSRTGPFCQACGGVFGWGLLTIDHIRPISKGGHQRAIGNLQLLCKQCNEDKGDDWDGVSGLGVNDCN